MGKTLKQVIVEDVYLGAKRLGSMKKVKGKVPFSEAVMRVKYQKALAVLKEKMYTKIGDLSCEGFFSKEPLPFERKTEGEKIALAVGKGYAKDVFDCAWLHITGKIPSGYTADEVVFLIDTAGEGLVFDKDGHAKQGITTFCSKFDYTLGMPEKKVVLTDGLTDGENIDFFIDCGANDLFGELQQAGRLQKLDIAVPNRETIALYYDLEILLSVYDVNKNDEYIREVSKALKEALALLPTIDERGASALREKISSFMKAKNDGECFSYSAIGHAHLDLAWLWPIRETIRKGGRTFATQLVNIRLFDGYVFGASQAQLYLWVKENYPDVYEGVKKAVADGRWEVQGATWVEPDSNLTCGESLVRQFLYGKKFFKDEFGLDMEMLWLPDSFGYSACLPQIMKLADVKYFLTQKMSWNTVNKFPYHTFRWVGLDGSEVLAHMLPEDTYNGPATGERSSFGEKNYRERKLSDEAVSLFGIGDGGAGPGSEHIERAIRMKDIKGLPKYRFGKAIDYFYRLDNNVERFPIHEGELYLEKHQGTYTTRVKNKKYNRRIEFLLTNYEKIASVASAKGIDLPIGGEELEKIWKEALLYQFHDILPGSSINRVYEETDARYKVLTARLAEGIEKLIKALCPGKAVVNFNSYAYRFPLKDDGKWYLCSVPACGVGNVGEEMTSFHAKCGADFIENDKVKVTFDRGRVKSLLDKENDVECIGKGKGNVFTEYADLGDCWDFRPRNYKSKKRNAVLVSFVTGTDGAKSFARIEFAVGATIVKQEVFLLDGSATVSFKTKIDNHASAKDLRVAFPLSIKSDMASFNIQYGHLKRPTTENNSIETAQFEVSGQKFVDLSESGYGVSFITDCKYGYRVKHGTVDVCLVRSPFGGPGKQVDQGESEVLFALQPHKGDLGADTYKEAYFINNPPVVVGDGEQKEENFFVCDNENIVLDAVQKTGDDEIVLRLYNSTDKEQTARFSMPDYVPCERVNLFGKSLSAQGEEITLGRFSLACVRCVRKEN